jgi:hypothetical protein
VITKVAAKQMRNPSRLDVDGGIGFWLPVVKQVIGLLLNSYSEFSTRLIGALLSSLRNSTPECKKRDQGRAYFDAEGQSQ